jgi:hypothetical protein
MQITIELPDDIANQLQLQPANISRRFWNSLRLTTTAKDELEPPKSAEYSTSHPVGKLTNSSSAKKAYLPHTEDDLEQDAQAIRNVLAKE